MNPIISIIIPCFNSGKFLPDALDSIAGYSNQQAIETIIVDDGSTDAITLNLLEDLKRKGYTILHQQNKGPAAARNTGALVAKSDFLLFLDSDNKIRPGYIDAGVQYLTLNKETGVVYGNAEFFGEATEPRFTSQPFAICTLLMGNYIDVCSVVRKKAFQDIAGFDESRILFGHEDWELWIRMHLGGWRFHYINQTMFDYRVRKNSLLMQKSESDNLKMVLRFVFNKHLDLFIKNHELLANEYRFYLNDRNRPFRTFIKNLSAKYLNFNREQVPGLEKR